MDITDDPPYVHDLLNALMPTTKKTQPTTIRVSTGLAADSAAVGNAPVNLVEELP